MSRVTTSIQRLLSSFKSLDSLLESDEALQVLKSYLVNRRNSELMECILSIRNCKYNNTAATATAITAVAADVHTIVDNYVEFYQVFINVNSEKSLNLPSHVVQQAFDLYVQLTCNDHLVVSNQQLSQLFSLKIESIMKSISILIEYQINIEILPQFKKSTEYSTFILSKVIELGNVNPQQQYSSGSHHFCEECCNSGGAVVCNHRHHLDHDATTAMSFATIDEMLKEGNMTEHSKSFQKKKLFHLHQIKHFTTQDFKDKIGIKKIGHLKRIVRLVNQHFDNKTDLLL